MAEIFGARIGGFSPKFSEAIWGEKFGSGGELFKYIYKFDQIFKIISQERIKEWINLTIFKVIFKQWIILTEYLKLFFKSLEA